MVLRSANYYITSFGINQNVSQKEKKKTKAFDATVIKVPLPNAYLVVC